MSIGSEIRTETMKAYQNALITDAYRTVEARGWPTLMDDYDRCMERTMEFINMRDTILKEMKV